MEVEPSEPLPQGSVHDAAAELYGRSDITVFPATDAAFAAAFPSHELYVVNDPEWYPPIEHTMAWEPLLGKAYDLTKDFNKLLADTGTLVATAAEALRYGKAYGQVANVELQLTRQVVTSDDSTWLNASVTDPAATQSLGAWTVTFTTWAEVNGVLANWTIRFELNRVAEARWDTEQIAVGPFGAVWEAYTFRPGVVLINTYNGTGHSLKAYNRTSPDLTRIPLVLPPVELAFTDVTTRTNFDGTTWVVRYTTTREEGVAFPPPETPDLPGEVLELSGHLADAAVFAYETMFSRNDQPPCSGNQNNRTNWSFVSKDPDCVYEIFAFDADALDRGFVYRENQTALYVHITVKQRWNAFGYYLNPLVHTDRTVARMSIGHELFHKAQWYTNGPWAGTAALVHKAWIEGMARFSQTILVPDVEDDATSSWYGTVGAARDVGTGTNHFQRNPHLSLCDRVDGYPFGLYWGYLYWTNGGLETLRRIMLEIQDGTGDTCNEQFGGAITAALAQSAGLHDTHAGALTDFAVHVWRRDFRWGNNTTNPDADPRDWGTYLVPADFETQALGENTTRTVGGWGLNYVLFPLVDPSSGAIDSYHVTCYSSETTWSFQVVRTRLNGTFDVAPFLCDNEQHVVDKDDYDEVVFNAVRTHPGTGGFALNVAAATGGP